MATIAQAEGRAERRIVTTATRDRDALRAFLERDRLFAAYAICDLDDREFARTKWGLAHEDGEPVAIALEYRGLAPQPLFVMGDPEAAARLLADIIRPRAAYLAAMPPQIAAASRHYRVHTGVPMVRMWVDRASFRPVPGATARLLPSEIGDLNRLYSLGFTSWLPRDSVAKGVYFGIRVGGRLVSAAGTHVISPQARLAVVGNVMTHRNYRGRGYAKMSTSAVTQELLRTCEQVVLNVRADNPPALATYRALGYQEHVRFEERLVYRRGPGWDSIFGPLRRFLNPTKES
ncbi:MAG: GNAT family N-acetyltransferase [Chloroflexi bacterium]|nr:GNAT family N-acetyltransferase [Chloroflexota bacterium]